MKRDSDFTPKNCPGINKFVRPTMTYVQCHHCGAHVELWSDEDNAKCSKCGSEWNRPKEDSSCLEYCEYADKCKELIAST